MNIKHEKNYGRIEIDAEDLYQELLQRGDNIATLNVLKIWLKNLIYDNRHKPKEDEKDD